MLITKTNSHQVIQTWRFLRVCTRVFEIAHRNKNRSSNAQGGTSTTGNVARICCIRHKENQHDFLTCILTILKENDHDYIITPHENLAVILQVMNCSQKVDIPQLDFHCMFTYEFIICKYPWASITPTLHKVLAHMLI